MVEGKFQRRDLCIFSTRIALDVGAYFGLKIEPLPVRLLVLNAAFVSHLDTTPNPTMADLRAWNDGSWSLGVGYNDESGNAGMRARGVWNGHLIATADGYFGDFSIRQAERPARKIFTGDFVIGPLPPKPIWIMENEAGMQLRYERMETQEYLAAPDWRREDRRRRIVGALIRNIRGLKS
jgi:hypothetical protein